MTAAAVLAAPHTTYSVRHRTALLGAASLLASFTVMSPLLGVTASLAGRAVAPGFAVGLLLMGAPVTANVRRAAMVGMLIVGLGLVHGDVGEVMLSFAELIAVGGVLMLFDLTDDSRAVVRSSYLVAAGLCSIALIVATQRIQTNQSHVALGFVLAPALGYLAGTTVFRKRTAGTVAAAGLIFVGATTSGSRASLTLPIIALLIVLLVTARWSTGRKVVFVAASTLGVVYLLPAVLQFIVDVASHLPGVSDRQLQRQLTVLDFTSAGDDRSLEVRYAEIWPAVLRNVYEHPFGLGFGARVETSEGLMGYAHNVVLEGGLAFGWLGMLAMALFAFERLRSMLRLARTRPDLAVGGLTTILGLMLSGNTRSFPWLLLTFGLAEFRYRGDPVDERNGDDMLESRSPLGRNARQNAVVPPGQRGRTTRSVNSLFT